MQLNESLIKNEMFTPDELGMIFHYKEKILRGINETSIDKLIELFDCGLMQELVEKNLFPKTSLTNYQTNKYKLIVEHEKIEFISYCFEWSFSMMKDAALLVLEVESIANKYGYYLKDPHAYNVVYDANRPMYIDLGSFVKETSDSVWIGKQDYIYSFYIPLYLMTKGYFKLGRMLMYQYNYLTADEYLILSHPATSFLPHSIRKALILLDSVSIKTNIIIDKNLQGSIPRITTKIIRNSINRYFGKSYIYKKILAMKKSSDISTIWENYHDDIYPDTNERMKYIGNIIRNMEGIKSCLEIGANQGVFAEYILDITDIPRFIAVDYDEGAVDKMYFKNANNPRLQAVLADPFTPDMSDYYVGFTERFSSDLVIAMAVTHHLILSQNLNIKYILKKLCELTTNYLIIEFMPLGLYYGDSCNIPAIPDFYNEKWFADNLKDYFKINSRCHIEKNRVVFNCQKM